MRLYGFQKNGRIFYNKQVGFRSGHSTLYALAELLKNNRFDNKSMFKSILIDLRKAFETIDHSSLLENVEKYGVRGVCLDWFISYKNKTKQFVQVQSAESFLIKITCGVTQCSIIARILSIMYNNDIPNSFEEYFPICSQMIQTLYKGNKQNKARAIYTRFLLSSLSDCLRKKFA